MRKSNNSKLKAVSNQKGKFVGRQFILLSLANLARGKIINNDRKELKAQRPKLFKRRELPLLI